MKAEEDVNTEADVHGHVPHEPINRLLHHLDKSNRSSEQPISPAAKSRKSEETRENFGQELELS